MVKNVACVSVAAAKYRKLRVAMLKCAGRYQNKTYYCQVFVGDADVTPLEIGARRDLCLRWESPSTVTPELFDSVTTMCRGKGLQWATLPLLCFALAVPHQAHAAAVHRAQGVDAATARLLGQEPIVVHAASSPAAESDPGAYFAPDSWRPVSTGSWRGLSPGSNIHAAAIRYQARANEQLPADVPLLVKGFVKSSHDDLMRPETMVVKYGSNPNNPHISNIYTTSPTIDGTVFGGYTERPTHQKPFRPFKPQFSTQVVTSTIVGVAEKPSYHSGGNYNQARPPVDQTIIGTVIKPTYEAPFDDEPQYVPSQYFPPKPSVPQYDPPIYEPPHNPPPFYQSPENSPPLYDPPVYQPPQYEPPSTEAEHNPPVHEDDSEESLPPTPPNKPAGEWTLWSEHTTAGLPQPPYNLNPIYIFHPPATTASPPTIIVNAPQQPCQNVTVVVNPTITSTNVHNSQHDAPSYSPPNYKPPSYNPPNYRPPLYRPPASVVPTAITPPPSHDPPIDEDTQLQEQIVTEPPPLEEPLAPVEDPGLIPVNQNQESSTTPAPTTTLVATDWGSYFLNTSSPLFWLFIVTPLVALTAGGLGVWGFSGEIITKDLLSGSRQIWPQPRSGDTVEVVITPKPIRVPDPPAEPVKANARGPEVEDSIAAVASQLLATSPDAVMLDVRTPPLMKQKQSMEPVGIATPVKLKDEEAGTWSLVSTTQLNEKPITKVPEISKMATTVAPTPTPTLPSVSSGSTRFPPRKPVTTGAPMKVPMVEISIKNPSTEKPITETTTKKVTPSTTAPNKPTVVITKKPVTSPTASGQSSKPAPIAITVLKRNSTIVATKPPTTMTTPIKITTATPPVFLMTEKIPQAPTRKPQTPQPLLKLTTASPTVVKTTFSPKPEKIPVITGSQVSANIPKPEKAPLIALNTPEKQQFTKITTERPEPVDFQKISFSKPSTVATLLKNEQSVLPSAVTVPESATTVAPSTSTTKRPRRKSNKKKNKNRRRRPKPTPSTTLENKEGEEALTAVAKPSKPLSTRIYNFISRDVMPNFGVGVVGLIGLAGLAGLLLLPIDGFARRSDVNKREEEQDGILPSIIQAVMTSLNIGEKKYEEQGPRRFKRQLFRRPVLRRRQTDVSYNEVNSNDTPTATPVPAPDTPPFSFVRFMKQLLAVKLDVMANMLRVASEALRNYAQHAGQRPQITTTTPESITEKVDLVEPSTTAESITTEVTTEKIILDEDKEESNLVRRRTAL
ncbi:hypothetical protein B566_EDAN013258 [Ephemera danica]|nr:hypothetical protein B566_EDAN013258 [Ephemera danica]